QRNIAVGVRDFRRDWCATGSARACRREEAGLRSWFGRLPCDKPRGLRSTPRVFATEIIPSLSRGEIIAAPAEKIRTSSTARGEPERGLTSKLFNYYNFTYKNIPTGCRTRHAARI